MSDMLLIISLSRLTPIDSAKEYSSRRSPGITGSVPLNGSRSATPARSQPFNLQNDLSSLAVLTIYFTVSLKVYKVQLNRVSGHA